MLNAQQTAQYLGYSSTELLQRIPVRPVRLVTTSGQPRWDRRQLDAWLDDLSGVTNAAANDDDDHNLDAELNAWVARHGSQ